MIGLITLQRNNLLLRVIDVSITVTQVSTQCPYPIYQLCVFPPNLPVVCVLPPNLPVVCVSTQFTSCVCFHPIYRLCVFPPNLPVVCVFPPNLPVVCVSTQFTSCVCFHPIYQMYMYVCFHPIYRLLALPSYIPVVCVCVYVCLCFSTLYTGSPCSDLLLLPNTDHLQQVEDYVRSST